MSKLAVGAGATAVAGFGAGAGIAAGALGASMLLPIFGGAGYLLGGGALLAAAIKKLDQLQTMPDLFTPEAQKEILEQYREALGIGEGFDYSAGAFDKYIDDRNKSVEELGLFSNKKLQGALKKSPELGEHIRKILQPNPGKDGKGSLNEAQQEFEESANVFGKLKDKIPRPFKVEQVIQTMKELADEGVKGIGAQHAYEKANLTTQLDNPESDLRKELKTQGVTDISALKKSMLEDLDKAHKAQLKSFQDSTAASLTKLHQASQTEMDRVIFLATLSEHNEKMRLAIMEAADAKKQKSKPGEEEDSPLVASVGGKENDPNIGVVQISDLKTIYTNTGKTITQNDKGVFTLEFGRPLLDAKYYLLGNKPESDMLIMARAIKASGKAGIEFDVDFSNADIAKKRAKEAYKAGIEAGFAPDKIKVKINGKPQKIEELLGDEHPGLIERAKEVTAKRDERKLKDEGHDISAVKEEIAKLRKDAKESSEKTPEAEPAPAEVTTPVFHT